MNVKRRDARVVEEARLESVYTPKAYRGFESPSLRNVVGMDFHPEGANRRKRKLNINKERNKQ